MNVPKGWTYSNKYMDENMGAKGYINFTYRIINIDPDYRPEFPGDSALKHAIVHAKLEDRGLYYSHQTHSQHEIIAAHQTLNYIRKYHPESLAYHMDFLENAPDSYDCVKEKLPKTALWKRCKMQLGE